MLELPFKLLDALTRREISLVLRVQHLQACIQQKHTTSHGYLNGPYRGNVLSSIMIPDIESLLTTPGGAIYAVPLLADLATFYQFYGDGGPFDGRVDEVMLRALVKHYKENHECWDFHAEVHRLQRQQTCGVFRAHDVPYPLPRSNRFLRHSLEINVGHVDYKAYRQSMVGG